MRGRDGSHIKNLFYTFIWNTCPELFENGHIYAGVPPLYKITMSNGYKYLKDDDALIKFRQENKGKKYSVNRLKGYERVWPLSTFPFIEGVA